MAAKKLRLHYPDGRIIVEPLTRTARENGTNLAGARALLDQWVSDGDLVRRPDGGFDVRRFKPRQHPVRDKNGLELLGDVLSGGRKVST
jgi:hypothetical protein